MTSHTGVQDLRWLALKRVICCSITTDASLFNYQNSVSALFPLTHMSAFRTITIFWNTDNETLLNVQSAWIHVAKEIKFRYYSSQFEISIAVSERQLGQFRNKVLLATD